MRRSAVVLAAITAIAAAACGDESERPSGPPNPHTPSARVGPELGKGTYRRPKQLDAGERRVRLVADTERVPIGGHELVATVYNGQFQPPTLHVAPGETLRLTLVNRLDEVTNIHYHGLHVSPRGNSDNVFIEIQPGESQRYSVKLPPDHEPGLYWYHSHAHHHSSGQVSGGLAGLISVDGIRDLLPQQLRHVRERQIALKDVTVDPHHPTELAREKDTGGERQSPETVNKHGPRLINAVHRPALEIHPGETQLWRIANLGANMFQRFAVRGVEMLVVGEDGNPVWQTWRADSLVMPPGKRYEVLVQGPRKGKVAIESLRYRQGITPSNALEIPPHRIGTLRSAGAPGAAADLPASMRPRADLDDAQIAKWRRFDFSIPFQPGKGCRNAKHCQPGAHGGTGARVLYTINDQLFDPNVTNVRPALDTVEEWTLTNSSTERHPFHIHVNDFQVMSVNGRPYNARGLQDTVTIPPQGGETVVRIPFEDYTGRFVFHCHILNHEDRGMMQTVDVVRR